MSKKADRKDPSTSVDAVERGGVTYSPVGLGLREGMTFEEWDEVGDQIAVMHQASPWWIGDWYLAGERQFGEAASQARAISDTAATHGRQLTPRTVMDYASLCRRFAMEARIEALSFSHHLVVRSLTDDRAQQLLTQAKDEALSVSGLKKLIDGEAAPEKPPMAVVSQDAYDVVLADPPWKYSNSGQRGAAARHYSTMEIGDIEAFPVTQGIKIAENAVLYLWVTNPMIPQGLQVMAAWAFEFKSMVTWRKLKNGKVAFGNGFYFRSATEHMLLGVRGSMMPAVKNERTIFDGEILEHSRKPYESYELIERMYPDTRRLELFARHARHTWDRIGNEAPAE